MAADEARSVSRLHSEEDMHGKHHSTLWGDFFLHHVPCRPGQVYTIDNKRITKLDEISFLQYLIMKDNVEIMKEEVKKMLLDVGSSDLSHKLDCIDTLERLGLDYHYTKEIDELMCNVFEARDQDLDLTTTSQLFYLLRKHGYHISSDVFLKFRDDKGDIVTNDARWWKEFQAQANTTIYARDRMVEMHFWMMGVFFEPQYSYSRKMLTQLFMIVSVLDDLYDSHCTTEEGNAFTAALQRWDEEGVEQCPTYLRTLYTNIRATIKAIEEDLNFQNNKHAKLVKGLIIDMAMCYNAETEWRDKKYVPATVDEHLKISARSSGCMHLVSQGFISMGDVATSEALEWASTYPKIVRAVCIIARLANDIMSYKREASNNTMVSTVQTCAKEYGTTTVEQAIEKIRELIEEAWMDITHECLRQPQPKALLERAVNLARTMDFLYKDADGYTDSRSIKGILDSLYVHLID
ncbi:terpene synthase23 [Zea mays]|nr:terpene synthase23 [Zea mays]